jgi:hypothetical protein
MVYANEILSFHSVIRGTTAMLDLSSGPIISALRSLLVTAKHHIYPLHDVILIGVVWVVL